MDELNRIYTCSGKDLIELEVKDPNLVEGREDMF